MLQAISTRRASPFPFANTLHVHRLALALALCGVSPVYAQSTTASNEEIQAQLKDLRAQQSQISEMQQRTEASIRSLERKLGVQSPASDIPTSASSVTVAGPPPEPRLKVSGDLRLRAQGDYSDQDAGNRNSSQLRARIGATYALSERLSLGGRIVTGDGDDPNSSDVQLSNWDDDLQISLDLAYAQVNLGDLKIYGGKIPQPFARTDLVWDGDVNPQGIGSTYRRPLTHGGAFRANALFFTVDEQVAGPDSNLGGVQLGYDSAAHGGLKYDLSGGYYRYNLSSMAGADAGDWRSNRRNPDGSFVSDYELVDVIASTTWQGSNDKWPLRAIGNYVKNLGAADDQDTGFGVDLIFGRAAKPGDWRFSYGYSQTDVDAVLAAFSNDNIGIGTNYKLHALTLDYTPAPKTMISAIWYRYRPNDALYAGTNAPEDWLNRFRLFLLMNF